MAIYFLLDVDFGANLADASPGWWCRTLPAATGFEPFEPGYQWMPHRGETST
ncbi:hypothetical protein ACGFMK_44970 [Amycolatopsis sp. NPDC049252]|uniref:hypothetical protein n=1 Tax=Amycolatopsis sp. NPDC049252 TaxID=3363933 RepID=UPI00371C3760